MSNFFVCVIPEQVQVHVGGGHLNLHGLLLPFHLFFSDERYLSGVLVFIIFPLIQ